MKSQIKLMRYPAVLLRTFLMPRCKWSNSLTKSFSNQSLDTSNHPLLRLKISSLDLTLLQFRGHIVVSITRETSMLLLISTRLQLKNLKSLRRRRKSPWSPFKNLWILSPRKTQSPNKPQSKFLHQSMRLIKLNKSWPAMNSRTKRINKGLMWSSRPTIWTRSSTQRWQKSRARRSRTTSSSI